MMSCWVKVSSIIKSLPQVEIYMKLEHLYVVQTCGCLFLPHSSTYNPNLNICASPLDLAAASHALATGRTIFIRPHCFMAGHHSKYNKVRKCDQPTSVIQPVYHRSSTCKHGISTSRQDNDQIQQQFWASKPFLGFSTVFWERFWRPITSHFHTGYE